MKISVIIPCFNEKNTAEKILNKVIEKKKKFNIEIIVIDDFSNDGTIEILKKKFNEKIDILMFNEKNFGKGYCIRKGLKFATGQIILIQDADLEYNPEEYKNLLNPFFIYDADVVYGSRFKSSVENRVLYFWHSIGNKFLTFLSNLFTNLNLTDMETCYKIFKSEIIKSLVLKENRFGFEPEVTAKIAKKKDIKIFEVGISYHGRTYDEGKKINWKDGFIALFCIFKYNILK